MIMNVEEIKEFIIKILDAKKAKDIITLDVQNSTNLAKYMIFATGSSIKNIGSIADHISIELKHKSDCRVVLEGIGQSSWVIVDIGDIMLHLFTLETRTELNLEAMWQN